MHLVTLGERIANASPHHRLDYQVWAQHTATQPPAPLQKSKDASSRAGNNMMVMKSPTRKEIQEEPQDPTMIQRRAIQLAPSRYTTKLATYRMSIVESSPAKAQQNTTTTTVLNPWNVGVVANIKSNGTIVILSPSGKVSQSTGQEKQLLRRIKKHRRSSSSFSSHIWIDYGNVDDMNLPLGWLPHNDSDKSDDDVDHNSSGRRSLAMVASEDTMASTQDEKLEDIIYDSECNGYLMEDGYFLGMFLL